MLPHNGTETSAAAAESMEANAANLRGLVFRFLKLQGINGATDEEIQIALGMTGNTERPRRRELFQRGLIAEAPAMRRTRSGREAQVWVLKEYAPRQTEEQMALPGM